MDVYKTEEEQIQAIKTWWKDNAVSLIAGIVIGIIVLAGYKYWTDGKQQEAQQASAMYSALLSYVGDKTEFTKDLQKNYYKTPYAALATLLLVKDSVNANNVDKAITGLKWVIKNNHSDAIKHLAQQRLARLYLSKNNIAAAEELIKGIKADGFSATYNEVRGDINLAKKLPLQAKENYKIALSSLLPGDQRSAIIKMKLDDLTQASKVK